MRDRGLFGTRRQPLSLVVPIGLFGLVVLVSSCRPPWSLSATTPRPEDVFAAFDDQARLMRPTSYRRWVHVGTPITPNDMNRPEAAFPGFHSVYIDPVSYEYYLETGHFPDGTVLIKELVDVGSKSAASGRGYFMGEFIGLQASVKDAKRFPDEPGNWAYFSFGQSYPLLETAPALPAGACNGCHEASARQDWVFTQHYPVLRVARKNQ